ncbi:hypothetical protein CCS01_12150 [Rhodopila globiformis]|uniref:Uncharacterized protein n=1 Tax=Rhodopila globiformis TaxID=1071 RepID=A0A2S6NHU1_RHOGL|nr:hypothetical protein CCS01_12150 [Rhodopila globiformis]
MDSDQPPGNQAANVLVRPGIAPSGTTAGALVRHRQAEPNDLRLQRHSREAEVVENGMDALTGRDHAAQEGVDRQGNGGGSEREQPTSPDDRGHLRLDLALPMDRHHPLRQCNREGQ